MLDPELIELMTQTVRFYAPVGTDEYGYQKFSTTYTEMACHIRGRLQMITIPNGELKSSTGTVYLAGVLPALTDAWTMDVPDLSSTTGWRGVELAAVTLIYDEAEPCYQAVHYGERGNRGRSRNE